ncbi:aromatic-ring-hydroxylating dioxygenase subunit beta [Salirhabdus sp. Marseille-P4669]|uniref:aromatic-ring-hydroxylating dioxygenase subunit beta n=1 Tax=Salirhabdus sp. Marseille-P4669 TaxID=2042310 RepID=UPI000C7AB028|nr:3-phenylpropionate/cinnamic acid dioxygenase subunit beta [Salirhabdus sp. Marseille-P4669]
MSTPLRNHVTPDIYFEITTFLHQESYYLDHKQFKEWLELFTDDVDYRMPLRETVEGGLSAQTIATDSSYLEETKVSLKTRVNRLYTKSAWVENPTTRQRHFISNIIVEPTESPDEWKVKSYFLFKRSRASTHELEELFGERHDIIRNIDGEWKIASRIIYPDQTVITTMNMSMFL